MKKSKLRNIIKESIKELMNGKQKRLQEQGGSAQFHNWHYLWSTNKVPGCDNLPPNYEEGSVGLTSASVPGGSYYGDPTTFTPLGWNTPATAAAMTAVYNAWGAPSVGEVIKINYTWNGVNQDLCIQYAGASSTMDSPPASLGSNDPSQGQWSYGINNQYLGKFPDCETCYGTTNSQAPSCAEIKAENCDNPAMGMVQPCVTIDGQIPDQSYVGTAIEANNKAYLINSVSPSTSAPFGTVDLPQTGVQGCPGQGTFGIGTGGAGFNYPGGWDAGNWTNNFVNMILNHPNPCNFLTNQLQNFINQLFGGFNGNVNFDINGNITPPGAAAVGVLQANLLMQKIVVVYELMGMVGCGNLEEQDVNMSSIRNIKMDPKAKDALRKSADKLKGLATKKPERDLKPDPTVDRMQKLAGIPTDKPTDKPTDIPTDKPTDKPEKL